MKNSVIIKGNKYGVQIVLDPEISFDQLLDDVATKFRESARFFNFTESIAVGFSGRTLSGEQQNAVIRTIMDNTELTIGYVVDGAPELEDVFRTGLAKNMARYVVEAPAQPVSVVETTTEEPAMLADLDNFAENHVEKNGQFYRGTLRSGQKIEVDGSIVILGDINPGAQVIAGGNVVVLGCLKGIVAAGYPDDKHCFVASLLMDPMQIQIGPCIARSPDKDGGKGGKKGLLKKKKQPELEAKIAFVENDNIFIETITRSLVSELSLG